jgi:hypothetical protein
MQTLRSFPFFFILRVIAMVAGKVARYFINCHLTNGSILTMDGLPGFPNGDSFPGA